MVNSTSKIFFVALFLNLILLVTSQGTQFITGPCSSDADCASSCCGFRSGKCAGPVIAQERDGGCGFGDPQPNDRAAVAFRNGQAAAAGASAAAPMNSAVAGSASGSGNTGIKQGTQFITGVCTSDADCASSCCGFRSGKCAGPVIAQERDGGCGFGDAQPNDRAAVAFRNGQAAAAGMAPASNAAPAPAAGAGNTGTKQGTQFITGACTSDADCASGCCGFRSGKCAGPVIAQERDGGCGFGDAQPNDNAARIFRGQAPTSAANAAPPVAMTQAPAAAGANGAGNGAGKQFITGPCSSDADCASACCGFRSGKCAGPIIAQERDGGCGFGDASPNDRAAQALRGGKARRGVPVLFMA